MMLGFTLALLWPSRGDPAADDHGQAGDLHQLLSDCLGFGGFRGLGFTYHAKASEGSEES